MEASRPTGGRSEKRARTPAEKAARRERKRARMLAAETLAAANARAARAGPSVDAAPTAAPSAKAKKARKKGEDGAGDAKAAKRARREAKRAKRAAREARESAARAAQAKAAAEAALCSEDEEQREDEEDEEVEDFGGSAGALVQANGRTRKRFWKEVTLEVNQELAAVRGPRPRGQIREKVYTSVLRVDRFLKEGPTGRGKGKGQVTTFTKEDTATLMDMHARGCTWPQIGEALGRYYRSCMDHYNVQVESAKLGPWSAAEDAQLIRLVEEAMQVAARARQMRDESGLEAERPDLRYLSGGAFTDGGLPWKAIAARAGRTRTACFRRWHYNLSPRARRVSGAGREKYSLQDDLALVRALRESGAEDESEVSWSNLIPGSQNVRAHFRFLARRLGCAADDGSVDLAECVDRLLPLLEAAHAEAERRAAQTEEHVEEFREACGAAIEAEARAEARREARKAAAPPAAAAGAAGGAAAPPPAINEKNLRGALGAAAAVAEADGGLGEQDLLTSSKIVPGQARGRWSEAERQVVEEVVRGKLQRELAPDSRAFRRFLTTAPPQKRQRPAASGHDEGEIPS